MKDLMSSPLWYRTANNTASIANVFKDHFNKLLFTECEKLFFAIFMDASWLTAELSASTGVFFNI